MRRIALAALSAALMAPAAARPGLILGVDTGLSKTGGSITAGAKMSNAAGGMVPLRLEAGWKFADRLTVAGFFTIDFGIVSGDFKASCDASGADCSANQSRVGAQVRWNLLSARRLDPWVGGGVAWEVLGIERTSGTTGVNTNYQGIGWDVHGGFDYWISQRFSVSPYLGLSLGKYSEAKLVSEPLSDWEEIPNTSVHLLVTAGVRIAFDFGGMPRSDAAPSSPPPSPTGAPPVPGQ